MFHVEHIITLHVAEPACPRVREPDILATEDYPHSVTRLASLLSFVVEALTCANY